LADAIENAAASEIFTARFIESTHEDVDPVMEQCLKISMAEFLEQQQASSTDLSASASVSVSAEQKWLN
jgi:hypothetical protein